MVNLKFLVFIKIYFKKSEQFSYVIYSNRYINVVYDKILLLRLSDPFTTRYSKDIIKMSFGYHYFKSV